MYSPATLTWGRKIPYTRFGTAHSAYQTPATYLSHRPGYLVNSATCRKIWVISNHICSHKNRGLGKLGGQYDRFCQQPFSNAGGGNRH